MIESPTPTQNKNQIVRKVFYSQNVKFRFIHYAQNNNEADT